MKIALIAHDKKKNEIIELSKKYKDVLSQHELYATGTTGTLIMGETGLTIHRMKSGLLVAISKSEQCLLTEKLI